AAKTTDLVIISDEWHRITWVNEAFEKRTGYFLQEIRGKRTEDLLKGKDTDPQEIQRLNDAIKKKKNLQVELLSYNKDGMPFWIDITLDPVMDSEANCSGFIYVGKVITCYKEEEERLKLLESVVTHMNESVMIAKDENGTGAKNKRIMYVNDAYCRMSGYSRSEIVGNRTGILIGPDTDPSSLECIRIAHTSRKAAKTEFLGYKKSGEPFWVNMSLVPVINSKGHSTHWISIERDVTERKHQQQAMADSLKEKEILLSEIHHRVKNNLAVISGLMQLQAEGEKDERVILKLLDSVARIKTIANIHEQIYEAECFVRIDFAETISLLMNGLLETFPVSCPVTAEYQCESVYLNINQVLPCSLILNEVITNALKHAFIHTDEGRIIFRLKESNGEIFLQVEDNGKGLYEQNKENKTHSLGMHLVDTLSNQLRGTYSFTSEGSGCLFTLYFKANDQKGVCAGM
ncbi:PAS domain-containing protein, partial [Balneolaceae bacterium ANBcel3]|nr:PAS domain-containing protein [Balneolaceae bacterium ANBcel3]